MTISWSPINDWDNFNPEVPTNLDPNFTYPDYVTTGLEPVPSGVPNDNPTILTVRLGRVIGEGSEAGTFLVRTYDGWLLDQVYPHSSYEIGDFMLLLVCGTWCTDLGQRTYLPPIPTLPA